MTGHNGARYSFILKNEDQFDFTNYNVEASSLQLNFEDSIKISSKIVENSNMSGAVEIGERRVESKERFLTGVFVHPKKTNDIREAAKEHREMMNRILNAYIQADYLVDNALGIRIKVTPAGDQLNIKYLKGSVFHYGEFELHLKALTPFWESLETTKIEKELIGKQINKIEFTISGGYDVLPMFIYDKTTAERVGKISFFDTVRQVQQVIDDSIFGENDEKLIVDNEYGTVTLGNLDRTQSLEKNSSFISLGIGVNKIDIIPDHDCNITIQYKERFFL